MSQRRWLLILGSCTLSLAILLQVPQILYQLQPQARGVLVQLTSDEPQYLARLEKVLTGHFAEASQPFTGDASMPGLHLALIEQVEGTLFRFTGLRAAMVLQIFDSIIPPLLFLTIILFFRLSGFSRSRSIIGGLLFVLPLLYSLNRPVHQRTSFLLALGAIVLSLLALEPRRISIAVAAGFLLGLLVGVYFWSWTFAWAYVGLLTLWEGIVWLRSRPQPSLSKSAFGWLFLVLAIGSVVAIPFVWEMIALSRQPGYADAFFRTGVRFSHRPESWVYSLLFLGIAVSLLIAVGRIPALRGRARFALLVPVTVFVILNQQVVHGVVLFFFSHYAFAIAFGAVSSVLLGSWRKSLWLLFPLLAGGVLLIAIASDNRYVLQQFSILPSRYAEQHFASLLPVLDRLPRSVILSDSPSSAFIAGSTEHSVLYSIYLKETLISHREMAKRFCMTQLPLPSDLRHISDQPLLLWPDANRANPGTVVRLQEVQVVEEACREIDRDPGSFLQSFGVQYVLWDKARQPQWDLKRLRVPLTKVAGDDGWELYRINH